MNLINNFSLCEIINYQYAEIESNLQRSMQPFAGRRLANPYPIRMDQRG
jgi:hypothetical protein